jgi:hypothetical protein
MDEVRCDASPDGAEKVGGTGTRPVPGEMDVKKGIFERMNNEGRGSTVRPASEQGTQGWFGRLAKHRFTVLPV